MLRSFIILLSAAAASCTADGDAWVRGRCGGAATALAASTQDARQDDGDDEGRRGAISDRKRMKIRNDVRVRVHYMSFIHRSGCSQALLL
jgi:hypothetical protein